MLELTDDDVCPIGKYSKTKTLLKDVPTEYLAWFEGTCVIPRGIKTFAMLEYAQKRVNAEMDKAVEGVEEVPILNPDELEELSLEWDGPQDKWHGERDI